MSRFSGVLLVWAMQSLSLTLQLEAQELAHRELSRPSSPVPSAEAIEQAGHSFRESCITCHQAPDLRFATDRAWLDQLNRTA